MGKLWRSRIEAHCGSLLNSCAEMHTQVRILSPPPMDSTVQIVFNSLTLLGVGGILGGYISFWLNKSKELEFKKREQKEHRYKSCILYMDVYFEPKNIKYLSSRQMDIKTAQDVIAYLKAEYHEMLIYASKEVILSVKKFIVHPTKENYLNTIISMRRDLWIKKSDLSLKEINIDFPKEKNVKNFG